MAAYAGQTALTALWNKLIAVLAGKADRNSVYSKAEVDYKLATTYGTGSGSGGGDTSDCVHITGTETITGTKTFVSSGFKIRSTSTSYSATIANTAGRSVTINLPTSSGTHYLVSRTATTITTNQLTAWSDTVGVLKNSGYTVATSVTSSSSTIPTSAAVKSYVDSNSGGGGGGVYEYIIDGSIYGGQPYAILLNYDSITAPSSSTYKYYMLRYRRAHGRKKWSISYLGIKYSTVDRWSENKTRWNISTTGSSTQFWAGAYNWQTLFKMHNTGSMNAYNGGGYTHTFGCAIFKESGGIITRVSNIAAFTANHGDDLTRKKDLY